MDLAGLSRCERTRVGCTVIRPDLSEVVAIGYNGPARGLPNDGCRVGDGAGACGCIHAEANALVKLKVTDGGLVLISTLTPCEHCAGLILNSGRVAAVVAGANYRDAVRPLEMLRANGVGVFMVSDVLGGLEWAGK